MSSVFLPPPQTRLVTICAHVDHGKTTLADNLIESNGIISERLAGSVRYLDSMAEEQRRGITMRTSAIGLKHRYTIPKGKQGNNNNNNNNNYVDTIIHLLDSPGHTDFSYEVSTSLQCCDGALIVIDAVEGICARTHQVLREAYVNQLIPILIVNKLDRLCTELHLSSNEAYIRLRTLIESLNATSAAMLTSSRKNNNNTNNNNNNDEKEDGLWTFEPSKGNVVFASALHGWGFTIPALARQLFRNNIIDKKIKPIVLKQYLFGDYKYRAEDCKIIKLKHGEEIEVSTLFAEFALQPIWDIYNAIVGAVVVSSVKKQRLDDYVLDQIVDVMKSDGVVGNSSSSTILNSRKDILTILSSVGASTEESILRCLLRRYRPLNHIVLDTIYEICPSPDVAVSLVRSNALSLATTSVVPDNNDTDHASYQQIQNAFQVCDPSINVPVVAHVSKFMAVDRLHVNDPNLVTHNNSNNNRNNNETLIIGFARVLSGVLKTNEEYYTMGPKYDGTDTLQVQKRSIRLYLLMGSSLIAVKEVPAGHICGIYNLEELQFKTVTLCSSMYGMPLRDMMSTSNSLMQPLMKVNIDVVNNATIGATDILENGLMKLSLADPSVHVYANSKGERILSCLGEIHLEQCILDLQNIYCCASSISQQQDEDNNSSSNNTNMEDGGHDARQAIKLRISDPIVDFGETTDWFYAVTNNGTDTTTTTNNDGKNDTTSSATASSDFNYLDNNEKSIEVYDYQRFYDYCERENNNDNYNFINNKNSKKNKDNVLCIPRQRQITIPPYNEEEGLVYAKYGRTRTILSGKCAAISLRVLPLSSSVYESIKSGKIVKVAKGNNDSTDGEDNNATEYGIIQIGYALGCYIKGNNNNNNNDTKTKSTIKEAERILSILCDCLCSIDGNGNVILESQNVTNGICVKGVPSNNGEVYVPPSSLSSSSTSSVVNSNSQTKNDYNNRNNNGSDESMVSAANEDNDNDSTIQSGKNEYEVVCKMIRDYGLLSSTTSSKSEKEGEENKIDNKAASNDNDDIQDKINSNSTSTNLDLIALGSWKNEMRGSAVAGFQLAMRAGPICEEPVRNVLVVMEGVEVSVTEIKKTNKTSTIVTAIGGMVVPAIRSGIRCCLLTRPARLMECYLRLTLHSSVSSLGSLYNVLTKRRGKVIEDDMVDGTDLLNITAIIPHGESFGLTSELYSRSSGQVTAPELLFSHWDKCTIDPFWVPTTLMEREDYGDNVINAGDISTGLDNTAIRYIRKVRQRKGLIVNTHRTVVAAEKQRTRKR